MLKSLAVLVLVLALSNSTGAAMLLSESRLQACPGSPNCVHSDELDGYSAISPLQPVAPSVSVEQLFTALVEFLEAQKRMKVVELTPSYIRVEAKTRLLGFVDDLEFELRNDAEFVAVRSASRRGHSDLGKNRKRIERIRLALADIGLVRE